MFTVEKLLISDTEEITKLNHEIFKDEVIYESDYIKKYCEKSNGFKALVNDKIVGYIMYGEEHSYELQKRVYQIISIGVLQAYQNKGIGNQLMRETLRIISDKDVYLHVRVTNTQVHNFYKKIGFTTVCETKKYYNLIKYGVEDAYFMKKKSLKNALRMKIKEKQKLRL
jgi:ribosomal protein S18 acetylase RimI-like enzyme